MALFAATSATSFISQNPYGTMFGIGVGTFAVAYLIGKKALRPPNDNIRFMLTGQGYQNPDVSNERKVAEGTATFGEKASNTFNHLGQDVQKPLVADDGRLYYDLGGKKVSPSDMWANLFTTGGYPKIPSDIASTIDVNKTREAIGNYRPSAADPSRLTNDPALAQRQPSFYPNEPDKANIALSWADKNFIDAHKEEFKQAYGDKALSHGDVQQLFVKLAGARVADLRDYTDKNRSWISVAEWENLKTQDDRDRYEKKLKAQAALFAQRNPAAVMGNSSGSKPATSLVSPAPNPSPTPKPSITSVLIGPTPQLNVASALGTAIGNWWSHRSTTDHASQSKAKPIPKAAPTPITRPVAVSSRRK